MEERLFAQGWATYPTFGGLAPEYSDYQQSRFVLLPLPYDLTTSYRPGARGGPQAILSASRYVELYDEELQGEPYQVGIHTLPALEPVAAGPEAECARVEQIVGWLLDDGKFPILLGGEHALTIGAIAAVARRRKNFSVLQFDAHADLRDEYEGTRFSHACVGRRIAERARLVQIGIRSLSAEEASYLKSASSVTVGYAAELQRDPLLVARLLQQLQDPVYITIDLDVFDPSIMPATGTPEPGGLDWYAVINLLRTVCEDHEVIGADVVELAPLPGQVAPDFLAAKLIYKLVGYLSSRRKGGQE
jgi:agmatinase